MGNVEKLLAAMRGNPRDWRITQLETIARQYGLLIRKSGGSHVVFGHPGSDITVTLPAHRPIKPVYIKQFLRLIDSI